MAQYLLDIEKHKMWRVFSMLEALSHNFVIVKHITFWIRLLYWYVYLNCSVSPVLPHEGLCSATMPHIAPCFM